MKYNSSLQKHIFIIEHLEPELWPWSIIEYQHISKIVNKNNLWFANIKNKDIEKLKKYGRVFTESIKDFNLKNACVLDPESSIILTPKEIKQFKYLILGGILGDNPPKKRTKQELSNFLSQFPSFNIGKEQMSTDNAVYVIKKIIEGKNLENIKFKDNVKIKINDTESTILPYRYVLIKGKPLISKKLLRYLKKSQY
ncbi:MAG: SAM-dependent methyltransferase [Nanoarchaeota archaeon]